MLAAGALPASAQPIAVPAAGSWTHEASGMVFPQTVGAFRRAGIWRYDQAGLDVSANYHRDTPGPAIASFYVYPMPAGGVPGEACAREFALRRQELERARPGARLVREADEAAPAGARSAGAAKLRGRLAAYLFQADFFGPPMTVRSELHLFCHVGGRWFVKYRLSAPADGAAEAFGAFMADLAWRFGGTQ